MTTLNPSLFEAIACYLFPYGTHSARPAAGDVPIQSFYFETDTTNLFQNQAGTWVQVASIGGGGAGVDIQVNGVSISDQTVLNFLDTASVTWNNPADGDVEATAAGGGGGGLILVEKQLLTSAQQNITFSSLDGNTDVNYRLKGLLKLAQNSTTITLKANSVTTNQTLARVYNGGADTKTNWEIIGPINSGTYVQLDFDLQCQCNPNSQAFKRSFCGTAMYSAGTVATFAMTFSGFWNDSTTNLTSLQLATDVSSSLADGSWLALYKYAQA